MSVQRSPFLGTLGISTSSPPSRGILETIPLWRFIVIDIRQNLLDSVADLLAGREKTRGCALLVSFLGSMLRPTEQLSKGSFDVQACFA